MSRERTDSDMSLMGIAQFWNRGITFGNLRVRENEDRDDVWNHYKNLKKLDKKEFSDVYLIRRRKSRKHWKQWRKDFELKSNPEEMSSSYRKGFFLRSGSKISPSFRTGIRLSLPNIVNWPNQENKQNERYYALKCVKLHKFSDDRKIDMLRKEVSVMKTLDHPYIVKAFETYEVPRKKLFIVMELLTGGDLWSRSPYSEEEAARIMGQLMSAITYMHDHKIIHRDLKLENVMFESEAPDSDIKVIDFGLSVKFSSSKVLTARVGTVYAMSPEVIKRQYTSKADTWACGVIAFALIAKKAPFVGKNKGELMDMISRGNFEFAPSDIWKNISKDAKEFISKLLEHDSSKRLSSSQALNHKWLKIMYSLEDRRPSAQVMEETNKNLIQYNKTKTLKTLALYIIASRETLKDIEDFRQAFDQYDTLNNGRICYAEFKSELSQFNFTEEELQEKFESITFNSDKFIYFTDFIAALLATKEYCPDEEKLADAFDVLDCDDSGWISESNLQHFLDEKCFKIKDILEEADFDGDGRVTFGDFLELFNDSSAIGRFEE